MTAVRRLMTRVHCKFRSTQRGERRCSRGGLAFRRGFLDSESANRDSTGIASSPEPCFSGWDGTMGDSGSNACAFCSTRAGNPPRIPQTGFALTISANQASRIGSGGVENLNFPSLAASRLFRSIVSEVPPVTSTVITSGTATGFPHARAASPMSPNEEMTQASRPKRPAAATAVSSAAAAAGTRLRRPAPSKVRAEKSRPKETLCLRDLQRGGQRGDGASVRAARSSPAVQTRVNRRGSIPRTRLDGFPARSRL